MRDRLTSLLDFASGNDCDHVWEQERTWSEPGSIIIEDDTLLIKAETIAHNKCGICGREQEAKIGHATMEIDADISDYTTYDNPYIIKEWYDARPE